MTSDVSQPDFSPYIEKYFQLLSKGNQDEKKLALSNLPRLLSRTKYIKDPKTFDPILDALKDKDPSIREAAAASLKILGENIKDCCKETRIVPSLIEALKDHYIGVRREAAKALGFYGDTRAVNPLIHRLQKDQNLWVRLEAAYSLGQLNAKKAVPALFNSLKETNPDWRNKIFQQECLIAIREIGYRDTPSIQLLIKKIDDVYLKAGIIKTLGQFRSMAAKDVLFSATQDKTAIIRKLALQAIDRLPLVRTAGMPSDKHPKSDLFIKFLKDPSPDVRATSARFLGKTGDKRALGPLIDALQDNNRDVQEQAILSLGRYKDIKILTALAPFLGSPVGYAAATSFLNVAKNTAEGTVFVARKEGIRYAVKTRNEIPMVLKDNKPIFHPFTVDKLIQDYPAPSDKQMRSEPKMLRKISKHLPYNKHILHPVGVTVLIHALKNPDAHVKIDALKIISSFEDDRIEPALVELLDNPSREVRNQTMLTLYDFVTFKSLPVLIKALKDNFLRAKAARMLGILNDKRAVQPLLESLNDSSVSVRVAALNSLRNFDDPQISDANIRMLKDESFRVREVALANIRHKPDRRAVESIIPLLTDSKIDVLAAETLGIIRDKRAVNPLIKALNGEYRRDRQLMITTARVLSSFEESRITPYLIKKVGAESRESLFFNPTIKFFNSSVSTSPFLIPAIRVFQRYGDRKTVDILKSYLNDTDKELRKGAMFLFGMYQEEKALTELERSLNDPDPDIKEFTKEIIDRIRSKSLKTIKDSIIDQPGIIQQGSIPINPYTGSKPLPIPGIKDIKNTKGISPHLLSILQGKSGKTSLSKKRSLLENEQNIKKQIDLLSQGSQKQKKAALLNIPKFLNIPEYKKNPVYLDPVLNTLIDKSPSVREAAAEALNKIGENTRDVIKNTVDIVPPLIMALCDEYPGVRQNAAKALAQFSDKLAIAPLIERLYDENPWVRCSAASSLGELKAKEAISSFLDLFKDNTNWDRKSLVRNACLTAMNNMRYQPSKSVPMLIEHFNDETIRAEIVKALGRSYPPDAVETRDVLLKAAHDPDANVRRLAIEAISSLSRASAIRASKNDSHNIDVYIKSLKDPSAPVRAVSVKALSNTKDKRIVEPIIQVLHDRDEDVQKEAIIALGKLKDERALGELVVFFGSHSTKLHQLAVESFFNVARKTSDQRVYVYRKNGIQYVARHREDVPKGLSGTEGIRHPHAVDTLIHALSHDATDVKIGVLHEIWRFEDDRIEPALIKLLKDPSTKVRRLTLMQLNHFAIQKTIPRIVEALSDKDTQVREKAARLLGALKNKQAVNPLLERLDDSHVEVKRAAITALGNIQDKSAIAPLIEKLSDSDFRIRKAALYALPRFEGLSISDINLKMLKDDSLEVRMAAIRNIKKKPDKRAVDSLILLLEDSDMCILAAEALGFIGDPRAVGPLIEILNGRYSRNLTAETDKAFKLSAAKSLGKLKPEIAVKPLVNIINSTDQKLYLRIAAVNTLGEIGDKKATIPLINILTDNHSDMWLRATSASALGNIGDKKAVDALTKATSELLAPIRNAAEDALKKIGKMP